MIKTVAVKYPGLVSHCAIIWFGVWMKAEIINSFILAAQRVLTRKLRVKSDIGKIKLRAADPEKPDLICRVELTGAVQGYVTFCMPGKLSDRWSAMLTEKNPSDDKRINKVRAGVGIADMIIKTAGKTLEQHSIQLSIPQIVPSWKALTFKESMPIITVPFRTDRGNLIIDITYTHERNKGAVVSECA